MAKEVARFGRCDKDGGLINETLVVYENKCSYRGEVWDSGFKGWKSKPNKPIMSALFREQDKDKDLFRVCEYFGFKLENRLR